MRLSVHLLRRLESAPLAHLRASLHPEVHLTYGLDLPAPAEYEILVAGRPTREHLTASPNLQALVIPWAGLPDSARELMHEFPAIAVHNLHHNAVLVAEMAVALMLSAAKFIIPLDRALRDHDWGPRYQPNPSVVLEGKTALILGYGAIGQRVAHLCRGLGMQVTATRRNVAASLPDAPGEVHTPEAMHRLLPQANVLFICLPHTPETRGLIGEAELTLLPAGAILVNVGRGAIVDEAALYHALRDGTLHAAGLDVWYNYPADEASRSHTPPSAYPFHELDNVVMSPHRAGHAERLLNLSSFGRRRGGTTESERDLAGERR